MDNNIIQWNKWKQLVKLYPKSYKIVFGEFPFSPGYWLFVLQDLKSNKPVEMFGEKKK